jgi:Tfp pilus assembly protein PilN
MIKINLIGEKKQTKTKAPSSFKMDMGAGGKNALLAAIVIAGLVIAGGWSWREKSRLADWQQKNVEADAELERLKPIREKAERYEARKELLERKIALITELKKRQSVPVHILDQVSKNLPDFLWLERMSADNAVISIAGKATAYSAVSNFYRNLASSGYFAGVTLGRTFEVPEGVAFSLTCEFAPEKAAQQQNESQEVQG